MITIIVPFRPTTGGMSSTIGAVHQDENFEWFNEQNKPVGRPQKDDIYRCLDSLEKNSAYRHKIIVALDPDVIPREGWLDR